MADIISTQLNALKNLTSDYMREGQMPEQDAKYLIFTQSMADGLQKGADPNELYNSYPNEIKNYFEYKPEDLKRQQLITVAGLAVSAIGLLGYIGFGLRAAYIAFRAWRAGSGLLEIAKLTAVPAILASTFKQVITNSQMIVNNLNDVFHWGPLFGQQNREILKNPAISIPTSWITQFGKFTDEQIDGLLQSYQKNGVVGINNIFIQQTQLLTKNNLINLMDGIIKEYNSEGYTPTPAEVIEDIAGFLVQKSGDTTQTTTKQTERVTPTGITSAEVIKMTTTKTAKPKIFIGVVMGGRVGKAIDLVRQVDDKITDDEDLKNDIIINMTNWLKTLPGKLNYEVQVKHNPFDELGTRKMGMWLTLAFYITNNYGKRMFIDEILLGPIDPIVYYPQVSMVESITKEIPAKMAMADIKPTEIEDGKITTISEDGSIIKVVPESTAPSISSLEAERARLEAERARLEAEITNRPQPTPTPTPPQKFKNCAEWDCTGHDVKVYNTGGVGLILRRHATVNSERMAVYPEGTIVYINHKFGEADGYVWYSVLVGGKQGYMAGQYLLM